MKFTPSRWVLTLALLTFSQASLALSYIVLLKNPVDSSEEHVHITNSQGMFGINNPGYGAAIGKRIQTVRRYDAAAINADFSSALGGMSSILEAGLPVLPHSYVALLSLPQGPLGKLAFNSERGNVLLEKPGQAALIDGYSDDPFTVDAQQVKKDFAPALESLAEIIKAGFHSGTYIVLLESPDGTVGKVSFTDTRGKVQIDAAGQAVDMGTGFAENQLYRVEDKQVKADFGSALDSMPILPTRYVLLFQNGSAKLSTESAEEAKKLLADISARPASDVTINGHTDTVGKDALNDKLSQKRAEFVADLIRSQSVEPRAMDIQYHGKRELFVKTPDNTPELKNRRVVIDVR